MAVVSDRFARFRAATAAALLDGPGSLPADVRRAIADGKPPRELQSLVEKIRTHAFTVTDADVEALQHLYSGDQVFEIILAAAFGAADERLAAARRAVDAA
jgi:hypothetical protein